MWTLFIAVTSITFLYFFLALTRLTWRIFHVHVCVICASVATTWLALLVLYLSGYPIDPTVLAILMGGSVVGSMYKLQDLFLKKGWQKFWIIRWSLIVLGFTFVWSVLNERWLMAAVTAGVGIVIWLAVWPLVIGKRQMITIEKVAETAAAKPIVNSQGVGWEKAKAEFEEKMKHCCD